MYKSLFACSALLLASMTTLASNEPRLVKSFECYSQSEAVDKQGNLYKMFLEQANEHDVKFTIVRSDLTTLKEFTLTNVLKANANTPDMYSMSPVEIYGSHGNGTVNYDACATQGVYNDDDKWEVVIHYGEDDYRVINEDNEFVCVPLPEYSQRTQWSNSKEPSSFYYDDIEKVFYLKQQMIDDSGHCYGYNFYTYSSKKASNNIPAVNKRTGRAYPNPLPAGHAITIELNEPADPGTTVEIADMNGRVLLSQPIAASAEKVTMPSRNIHRGNLIYSVKKDGVIVESGKIIAY